MFYIFYCFVIFEGFFPTAPRHLVGNLPPYTNVSLKMILTNPEGRKESDETIIQTDEDGAAEAIIISVLASLLRVLPFLHDQILLCSS